MRITAAMRHRAGEESGFTLVEVLITASILTLVLASVFGVLFSVQRGFNRQVDRAGSVELARLAVESIQKELLSARNVTVSADGLTADAYTRTYETTRTVPQASQCIRWRIVKVNNVGVLQSQRWTPPYSNGTPVTTQVVVKGITNEAGTPLFAIASPQTTYAGRVFDVTVRTNANAKSGQDVVVSGSVLARNLAPGTLDPCASPQPSWP